MTVFESDYPCGILLGKLGIVCHHHHKPILCHLFKKLHDLYRRLGIKRTGRLICKKYIRIIYKGTGNRHTLHLSAGKLVGPFVDMLCKPHIFKCFFSTFFSFSSGYAADGQSQFHICQNGLMLYKIIALKYKSYGVIAVRIPVFILVLLCGD